jgi:uncharacterized protein YrzB (UPF0473 family)
MTEFNEIENKKLTVMINGEEKECDILFTYDADELDETFVGYTDNSTNEKGELNIYTSKYSPLNPNQLIAVTAPEEVALMNDVIKQIIEQYK